MTYYPWSLSAQSEQNPHSIIRVLDYPQRGRVPDDWDGSVVEIRGKTVVKHPVRSEQ